MKTPKHSAGPGIRKVLIVDDHPIVRESLGALIALNPKLVICAAVGRITLALEEIERHRPDLVILDINLPDGHGLELIKDIRACNSKVLILVFSMHDDGIFGERVLRAGAQGYVTKSSPPDALIDAINRVLDGKIAVSEDLAQRLIATSTGRNKSSLTLLHQLSDRELEVFQLLGEGLGTKEIAERLKRTSKTIETYRLRIKTKLKIATATQLVVHAARWVAENSDFRRR